ncbi:hypothetical protein Emin_0847 [Elusimicrobium minutum Pei191]|uniref:Uncharacterized protein n=1 Tax=Elusimicrobium minutum (strain Pei191) TaxID=445932 RepID=B2KD06_ELUMP|nr:hypothetical protein [Elusimicrobium minutum]ACC98402.1 hypothetical protein Emin_0847 [Elusimicrobium minutum Pei191]
MTQNKNDANLNRDVKINFLTHLQNALNIEAALELTGLQAIKLFSFLQKDKVFARRFDQIINLKLEIAFLDSALKTKSPTILSFALTNRLGEKYNKTKTPPNSAAPLPQIVFTDIDADETEKPN